MVGLARLTGNHRGDAGLARRPTWHGTMASTPAAFLPPFAGRALLRRARRVRRLRTPGSRDGFMHAASGRLFVCVTTPPSMPPKPARVSPLSIDRSSSETARSCLSSVVHHERRIQILQAGNRFPDDSTVRSQASPSLPLRNLASISARVRGSRGFPSAIAAGGKSVPAFAPLRRCCTPVTPIADEFPPAPSRASAAGSLWRRGLELDPSTFAVVRHCRVYNRPEASPLPVCGAPLRVASKRPCSDGCSTVSRHRP